MSGRVYVMHGAKVVSDSQNLRGMLAYGYKHGVRRAHINETVNGGAHLTVDYADGATCNTHFQSFTVCKGFIRARRSWGLTEQASTHPAHVTFTAEA